MSKFYSLVYLLISLTSLSACVIEPKVNGAAADSVAPEISTGIEQKKLVKADDWIVVAANPLASEAGASVIRAGGNAIDAMVAVQTVLGLVEPQSSGLGGGAFLVFWDAQQQKMTTFDGREKAPGNVTPALFVDEKGEPLKFYDAVVGGRSVGVPGTVKLLWETHRKYGHLPWDKVLEPAIKLAEEGFVVSSRLHKSISKDAARLSRFDITKSYFFASDGSPLAIGTLLKNVEYAATLKAIVKNGADAFYTGRIAEDIVKTVQTAPGNPGKMTLKDLAAYTIVERKPVCKTYREFDICGMGPPSSGAIAVGQILGTLESFDLAGLGPESPIAWQLIGDSSRLAFADRGRYVADSDFVPVPVNGLLDSDYLAERAKLIQPGKALAKQAVSAGKPEWDFAIQQADDESIELPSTSHFSIVDKDGNVISMTTTIENGFGSRLMTNGFLLNNELTDFSFRTHKNGYPIANRVEPGKRPRSSMAPTIVLKNGKPYMAVGSPGGSRIIGYVAKAIVAHLDWGMDMQEAINLPNSVNRFGKYDIEENTSHVGPMSKSLQDMGFETNIRDLNSGLHAILITKDGLSGGADPRREGKSIGD
ncbi:MAG: gamma-glutamyltransferase [Arenicella sp.]